MGDGRPLGSPEPLSAPALALLLLALLAAPAAASDTGLSGREGHPRERFPLTVHAEPLGDTALDQAVRRAVADWNALARDALGLEVFAWVARRAEAQVTLAPAPATSPKAMGVAELSADEAGVITPAIRIAVFEPRARGQTPQETVLYQIVAHELGHALGLPHSRDPRSLMCCVAGSVDFADAAVREAYVQARRRPDVRRLRGELEVHYRAFWSAH